jgi:hypothetical protein
VNDNEATIAAIARFLDQIALPSMLSSLTLLFRPRAVRNARNAAVMFDGKVS